MKNPYPGMNPYLERHWPDVHTRLITGIAEQLGERLPPDLVARAEERVAVDSLEGEKVLRTDITVEESWKVGAASPWSPAGETGNGVRVAEPLVVLLEPETERWVEIQDRGGRLVTMIELLSPTNKREGFGRDAYLARQREFLGSPANLVEIDLLRGGRYSLVVPWEFLPLAAVQGSMVCVSRSARRHRPEIYVFPLREALPAFRVPLRLTDPDVLVELQPLIDRCYRTGRYWLLDYREDPKPPLAPEDAQWADQQLRSAGLR